MVSFGDIATVFTLALFLAVLIEKLVGVVKDLINPFLPTKLSPKVVNLINLLISLIISYIFVLGTEYDLISALVGKMGLTFRVPYVGLIFTALILAKGASFVHDFTQVFEKTPDKLLKY